MNVFLQRRKVFHHTILGPRKFFKRIEIGAPLGRRSCCSKEREDVEEEWSSAMIEEKAMIEEQFVLLREKKE